MRIAWLAIAACVFAADKAPPVGEASNKSASVKATLYTDKESIKKAIGSDLEPGIVVLDITVAPGSDGKIAINRDDFLLRSDRDGQRATPYAPSQIAGGSVMMVKSVSTMGPNGNVMSENRGPVWGGLGGSRPGRLGSDAPAIGNTATVQGASADVQTTAKQKEDPLLAVLEQKVLAEKEATAPVSGQLYFLMEGKQKTKDLELLYKTPAGRLSVRFK